MKASARPVLRGIDLGLIACLYAANADLSLHQLFDRDVRLFCASGPDELRIDLEDAELNHFLRGEVREALALKLVQELGCDFENAELDEALEVALIEAH